MNANLSNKYTLPDNKATVTTAVLLITFLIGLVTMSYFSCTYGQTQLQTPLRPTLSGTTFPPPILYQLNKIPSYAITIPFSSLGKSLFEPVEVNIPVGMTVIWFNDDSGEHSVTTLANNSYLPPQAINSGPIPASGGSFIHTFSKPGIYNYYDQFDPSTHGRIAVGTDIAITKNMNMLIGGLGSVPFNPNHAQRVVLSFVPKTISIPPTIALTYQVAISNPIRPWLTFSHKYDTADGILDLELVPTHTVPASTNATTAFVTWGPDFRSQEGIRTTGTYHIKGPVLVHPSEYDVRVAIVAKDNKVFPNPIVSTFVLLPRHVNSTIERTNAS